MKVMVLILNYYLILRIKSIMSKYIKYNKFIDSIELNTYSINKI